MSEIPGQSGHALPDLQPPVCANSRLMRRGKSRPMDQPVDADVHGSFGQPRFAKTLDHQLRIY
jgi:hypothetical protein